MLVSENSYQFMCAENVIFLSGTITTQEITSLGHY